MNNIETEQFIFNFLEGNLNESERELCKELINKDSEFREKVNSWKSTYYIRNKELPYYNVPTSVFPKSSFRLWFYGGALFTMGFLAYHFFVPNSQAEVHDLELKALNSKLDITNKPNSTSSIFLSESKSGSADSIRVLDTKERLIPVRNKKNEMVSHIRDVSTDNTKQSVLKESEVSVVPIESLSIKNVNEDLQLGANDLILIDSIKMHVKTDSIEKVKKSKFKHAWDLLRNQRVIPME